MERLLVVSPSISPKHRTIIHFRLTIRARRWTLASSSDFHFLIGRSCGLNNIRVGIAKELERNRSCGLLVFPKERRRNASTVLFTSAYRVNRVSLLEWHGIFRFRASFFDRLFLSAIVNLSLPPAASRIYRRESSKRPWFRHGIHPPPYRDYLNFDPPLDSAISNRTKKGRSICIPSRVAVWRYIFSAGVKYRDSRKSVIATVTSWNSTRWRNFLSFFFCSF